MSRQARAAVVTSFTNTSKSTVLLASLKAGGVGLNLVAATHVCVLDFWWNSATEDQAIDRYLHMLVSRLHKLLTSSAKS